MLDQYKYTRITQLTVVHETQSIFIYFYKIKYSNLITKKKQNLHVLQVILLGARGGDLRSIK